VSPEEPEPLPELVADVVMAWCDAVDTENADAVWNLMDTNLKVAIAQTWLYDNRDHPQLRSHRPLQELSSTLTTTPPVGQMASEIWAPFMLAVVRRLSFQTPPFPREHWGLTSIRRPTGEDLEVCSFATPA
jgi:hypothetical protein